jgi:hypothetical protein
MTTGGRGGPAAIISNHQEQLMTIFVKIRQGFTATLGAVLHGPETILAVTEKEFEAIAHKVEVLAADVAADLHLTKGYAMAVSPAQSAARAFTPASPPATETAVTSGAAPTLEAATAAAEETQAAAETEPEQAEPAQTEPEQAEPAQTELEQAEPAQVDPANAGAVEEAKA